MPSFLDFEAPVAELEGKIAELRALAAGDKTVSIAEEVKSLEKKAAKSLSDLYQNLDPWQKAQVARHRSGRMPSTISGLSSPSSRPWRATASSPRISR